MRWVDFVEENEVEMSPDEIGLTLIKGLRVGQLEQALQPVSKISTSDDAPPNREN